MRAVTRQGKPIPKKLICKHRVIRGGQGVPCGYEFEGELDLVNGKVCYLVGEEVTLQNAQVVCPECGAIYYHDYRDYILARATGASVEELNATK